MELLLAMGMISMLALSLYACLRIAFRARDSAVRAVELQLLVHPRVDVGILGFSHENPIRAAAQN